MSGLGRLSLALNLVHRRSTGGGGGTPAGLAPSYDTRFGTATDTSTGWITLGLSPGAPQFWVNSVTGNDANDGLTYSTPKKTMDAANALFLANYAPGAHLMVAGGVLAPTMAGPRYPENNNGFTVAGKSGVSLTYPTAMLSYDRNDPTNTAKYGKLTGADMPIIEVRGSTTLFSNSNSPANYIFIQGIEFDSLDASGASINWQALNNGIGYQNCRFNRLQLNIQGGAGDPADVANVYAKTFHVSKCSNWGAWSATDKSQWIYLHGIEDLILEDCSAIRSGWRTGITRDDGTSNGAPDALSHGMYLASQNRNPTFRRVLFADSPADGFHCRTEATANCIVSLNEPMGWDLGGDVGTAGAWAETPSGVVITITDGLVAGGTNITSGTPRGGWLTSKNTIAPTKVSNVALLDNPQNGATNNNYVSAADTNPNIVYSRTFDKIHGYGYSGKLIGTGTFDSTSFTFTNCILDVLAPGTGNSTYSAAPAGSILTNDIPGLMGFASWSDLYNAALWRPDLPWAQALLTIGLPARGLTPTYQTVIPPSMAGITPRGVYPVGVPTNTGLPVVTGPTIVGQALSCSPGTWWNTPNVLSNAYQWKRNGTAISGATASTYTQVNADEGANITCTVTTTNSYGSESATSAAVGPVAAPSFTFIGLNDNFNDNSLDATKWATGVWYNTKSGAAGTVAETNSRIEVTPPANTSATGNGLKSLTTWDMTGKAAALSVGDVRDSVIGTLEQVYFSAGIDQNHYYAFAKVAGTGDGPLNIVRRNAADTIVFSITPYTQAAYAWWMITHNSSDNTVHFWTAPSTAANPPAATDWVHQYSEACDPAVLTPATAKIAFGVYASGSSATPVMVYFDGFNSAT